MQIPPELVTAKEAAEPFILSLPGVTGIGIGLRQVDGETVEELAIRLFVEPNFSIPFGLPEEIGGVAICIIQTTINPCALPDEHRYSELAGGIKITWPPRGHGTLGAIAQHTNASTGISQLVGLSCFHVVGSIGSTFPNTIWQATHPPFVFGLPVSHTDNLGSVMRTDFPDFPDILGLSNQMWGWTDSAIFRLDDGLAQLRTISKKIVGHDGGPSTVARITSTQLPHDLPQDVRKRGFMTGLTSGRIIGVSNNVPWKPGGPNARLKDQYEIEGSTSNPGSIFCVPGDSGSIVLEQNSATALGLLWGESMAGTHGFMSPITTVETRLGIKLVWV